MAREEEIKRASIMYHIYQYDNSYEEGETLDFYIKGFIEGAKWADTHPINVWHDPSEEPNGDEWHIAYIDVIQLGKQQSWNKNCRKYDKTSHCWSTFLGFLSLQSQISHSLSDLFFSQKFYEFFAKHNRN